MSWLLRAGATGLLGSILYPVYKFVIPPLTGEANLSQLKLPFKSSELREDKASSRIFKFGRELGIIVITPQNEVKAFSALCTHLDCTVQYRKDLETIWCACHNGQYDLEGRNISGPPPRPLEQYDVHISAETDEIFVSKKT
ncbi:MAG: Rieske 2Fe-2S domain-containing protein [Candidatus Zixiibacteriota bacterium]|nr:MAG: Rieske 2Fe-2S domain-containing protein [candidate division Zixibacteria bacterium]